MTNLKSRWLSLIDKVLENADEKPVPAQEVADLPTEELPIYTASAKEINYWHAFGSNLFLQSLLREYDLDISNVRAYDRFKIGYDVKRHVATFAVDENHYYKIPFDEKNTTVADKRFASLVLEKISAHKTL